MLYVRSIKDGIVAVKDTDDGVIETMPQLELLELVANTGVVVVGVANGRVYVPTKMALKTAMYHEAAKLLNAGEQRVTIST